jgi:hypothetical protein
MKKIRILTLAALLLPFIAGAQNSGDCMQLFNGRDLSDWRPDKPGSFEVINGELVTRSFGSGNDMYTIKQYGNFILRLEFLLSEVGNSGVFIRRDPSVPGSGFEVQLLAPWTPWRDDLHCTGSLYGHVAVSNRPDETTGRWYKMEISCDRNLVTVSINGEITTRADIDTVKSMEGKPFTGYIGLQGNHAEKENQFAKFRNICIIDLDTDPQYVIRGLHLRNEMARSQCINAAASLGAQIIQPLADLMADQDPVAQNGAKQALFDIAANASTAGYPSKEKKDVIKAIRKSIKASSSDITSDYLKWLAGLIRN